MVRVFVVDDHAIVRNGVRLQLAAAGDMDLVGEADCAARAVPAVLAAVPDVAIVDVRLPDGSGVNVVREIRSQCPSVQCIMFTSFRDADAFLQSVTAGASGYVTKNEEPDVLTDAVRRVAAGESLISREMIDELQARAEPDPSGLPMLAELSPQEVRVLELVVRGQTNREIGQELHLADNTVRNYVSHTLAKLGLRNRTQLAAYVAYLWGRQADPGLPG